jgi:Ser/Thr protein kinase RdoA (MazF antagonist)
MVKSEVLWLQTLAQETNLPLQKPVENRSGQLVTHIASKDGNSIYCTLMKWVEGEPYHRELESESTAYQIGTILATLHNHASQWEVPDGFVRPKRDIPHFEAVLRGLSPAVKDGRISSLDYKQLSKSISLLIDMIQELDQGPEAYGLMHSDMHKGNMLYHEGNIRLIDFSFCAFGNYMFDLGICLSDMKVELHRFCLQGYQSLRELPENYQQMIEGFFIGSVVGTFSFWIPNPRCQEILVKKVPQITNDFAIKFNRNERFWFSP